MHHALHPEEVLALLLRQIEEEAEQRIPLQRLAALQANGADARRMDMIVVGMIASLSTGGGRLVSADPGTHHVVPPLGLEEVEVQQPVDGQRPMGGDFLDREGVEALDRRHGVCELVVVHQVALVEDQLVGDRDLLLRLRRARNLANHMLQVDHRQHRVEAEGEIELHVGVEEPGQRRGIGDSRGLDHDLVEVHPGLGQAHLAQEEPVEPVHQIALGRAAYAAVGELQHVLVGAGDEVAVDPDLAELVDDDRDLAGIGRAEEPVDERGLAGAEEARQQRDGDALVDRAIVDAGHRRLTRSQAPEG